jgi:energy-coupling factor transporter ATP-binding protein EcfA2
MSTAPISTPADDSALRFPSLDSLRAAHAELLKRQREAGSTPELQDEVEDLVRRGQATGALLDVGDERWAAQGVLDYWATALFRLAGKTIDATLDEFDPELAPELADEDCPYVGLDAFRESTFGLFFGRERLVQAMLKRAEEERLLAVVGDSGSGKSSLVLAGVLPKLKAGALPGSEGWRYPPPMVPGSEPLVNLTRTALPAGTQAAEAAAHAARLLADPRHLVEMVAAGDDRPCVLVIDQFEELFTLCDDPAVRRAFADGLATLVQAPARRHTVVLTLRSDYASRVAQFESFLPLFEQAQVRVTPLSSPELREAIEKPAALAGLKFEEGVVDALLRDILGEPAGLPLLQFSLFKLWQGRERNRVTADAYRRLGGGRLGLAYSADTFYNKSLVPEEQITARRILLRMVRPSEGLEVTSSRVRREELLRIEDPGRVERVLDKLVQARLVRLTEGETPADDQVEVAHEALVRNWPRLVEWLEEERAEISTRRRLDTLVDEWLRLEKKGGLLDAVQVLDAERWLASSSAKVLGHHPELPGLVEASREAIDDAERQREAAHQRELEQAHLLADQERRRAEEKTRSTRIFRGLAAALAVLLLVAAGVAWLAFDAQRKAYAAQQEEEKARTAQQELATSYAQLQQAAALQATRRAEMETMVAMETADELQQQKAATEAALKEAKRQTQLAETARDEAKRALAEAQHQTQLAETARDEAKRALAEAQHQTQLAETARDVAERAQEQVAEARTKNTVIKSAPVRLTTRGIASPEALGLNRRNRPLLLGSSVGSLRGGTGSLCCVVRDRNRQRYLLSLAHVFEGEPGIPIVQPGLSLDQGGPADRIGILERMGKDPYRAGALVKMDPGVEVDLALPRIGEIQGIEQTVRVGDSVRLIGRGSGYVEGRVIALNEGLIVTSFEGRGGDAGAPVLSDDGELVGLLFGADKSQSFVLPIQPILRELGVQLVDD